MVCSLKIHKNLELITFVTTAIVWCFQELGRPVLVLTHPATAVLCRFSSEFRKPS